MERYYQHFEKHICSYQSFKKLFPILEYGTFWSGTGIHWPVPLLPRQMDVNHMSPWLFPLTFLATNILDGHHLTQHWRCNIKAFYNLKNKQGVATSVQGR